MFGRATIRLGIGPHSSSFYLHPSDSLALIYRPTFISPQGRKYKSPKTDSIDRQNNLYYTFRINTKLKLETVSIAEPLQNRQHAPLMLSTLGSKEKREGG